MTCRSVVVEAQRYRFCPENPPHSADRMRAVIHGRFLDELTGQEMRADLTVVTEVSGLMPRISFGGIAGLVGNPGRLFPGLGGGIVDLNMTVSADRYVTRRFDEALGPVADFPDNFQPLDLGDVMMHRQAVVLRGRVVQASAIPRPPLAGVTVRIGGIWSVFPAADVEPLAVMEAPNLVSLQPGLYAERSADTDVLRQRNMVLAAGEEKVLTRPAVAGDSAIRISDRVNLNPGDVLVIDPTHPDLAEYIEIASIDPASTDDQPATITLNFSLAHDHAEDTVAVKALLQPAGAGSGLARDGIPGDQTVFLSALTDLAAASVVEIAGSGNPEYQRVTLYEVLSDDNGDFRLPPISRVAQLMLHAEHTELPQPVDMLISPNYDYFEDHRDIVF